MPYSLVNGINHYYEWITSTETPVPSGKPVMLFIHGWGGSARYWESTAQAISQTFDCLLCDMRGFGRSTFSNSSNLAIADSLESVCPSYELETYAHDLVELLNNLGLKQVYLNAHSMGASIAVFFLNLYPERVHQAILTCSGIFEYDKKSFEAFYTFGGYVVKFRPRWLYQLPFMDRLFMQRFLHRPLAGTISRDFLNDFLMADYEAAVGTIFTCVSKKAAEEMPGEFARLKVPTLIIAGDRDIIIPAELGERAAALNPEYIQYIVMPDTAHFPMLEDAPTYLKHLSNFLKLDCAAAQPSTPQIS
ncbi:alpha/beta fold hydrolase [Leptolyngbyaceae cyanobacterium UHCC 1019]